MTVLSNDFTSTFMTAPSKVGLKEEVGDSRIFRDLEYAFCLQHIKSGENILDVGASQPWFLLELIHRKCKVTAIDINPNAFVPHMEYLKFKIDFHEADLTKTSFPNNSFSTILCISVLEHMCEDEDIHAMREIRRLTSKTIITLPCNFVAYNWKPRDLKKERTYDDNLLRTRILQGWTVERRAKIKVWDKNMGEWISENCFYLIKNSLKFYKTYEV